MANPATGYYSISDRLRQRIDQDRCSLAEALIREWEIQPTARVSMGSKIKPKPINKFEAMGGD